MSFCQFWSEMVRGSEELPRETTFIAMDATKVMLNGDKSELRSVCVYVYVYVSVCVCARAHVTAAD